MEATLDKGMFEFLGSREFFGGDYLLRATGAMAGSTHSLRNAMEFLDTGGNPGQKNRATF
jgi:hypothetical protein